MGEILQSPEKEESESLKIEKIIADELNLTEDEKRLAFRATPTSWLSSLVLGHEGAYEAEDKKDAKERLMKYFAYLIFAQGNGYLDLNGKRYDENQHGEWGSGE